MSTTITVLSGFGAKAAAAILIHSEGVRILLDAGGNLEPGLDKGWDFPDNLDAIIISHDHIDHCHGLQDLTEHVPIYATASVAQQLPHNANIKLNIKPLPLNGNINIAGIEVSVGQAGHSLAGIWVHLAIAGGVFYSGDFSLESQLFPFDQPPPAQTVLLDASYGLYQTSAETAKQKLLQLLATNRQILLPVPPSGRALEIALWLEQLGINDWQLGPCCLTPQQAQQLPNELFSPQARQQFSQISDHRGDQAKIFICGDADGTGGEALRLMQQYGAQLFTIYTGYLPSKAQDDVKAGRAACVRWNVHPRQQDLAQLIDQLQAKRCLPLFCQIDDQQYWRDSISERLIFTSQIQVNHAVNP